MNITNNAFRALNLFQLTVQGQWGFDWQMTCLAEDISSLADGVVTSLDGEVILSEVTYSVKQKAKIWMLPDGSRVRTGEFGLEVVQTKEEAAEINRLFKKN
ncbi:MAG: hypothetical protein OQJ97_00625 [Rhodospirillales bacterium]|nr:hypothetical protein [Rhodospirillales bacterium]